MNYLLVVQVFVRTPRWSEFNWRRHSNLAMARRKVQDVDKEMTF
jgi:hypothetical protein